MPHILFKFPDNDRLKVQVQLKGKTALISGAGRNSGRAIALTFAREGADLILVAKEPGDQIKQVAKECESLGVKALPIPADVGKFEDVNRMVRLGLEQMGKVDVLVCTAAIRPHKFFLDYSYEEWHRIFAVNLHSTYYLAKALVPGMLERKSGSIIALGSTGSLTPVYSQNVVCEVAAKHGLLGLIKALALELGPYGVRANLIALAAIDNVRGHPEWYPETGGKHSKQQIARSPLGRTGTPQEVANVALFLASDRSSYITGDRIVCAGGIYM